MTVTKTFFGKNVKRKKKSKSIGGLMTAYRRNRKINKVKIKKPIDEVIQASLDVNEEKIIILSTYMGEKRTKIRKKSIIIRLNFNARTANKRGI